MVTTKKENVTCAGATLAIGGVISRLIAYSAEPRDPVTRIGSESDVVTSSASEIEKVDNALHLLRRTEYELPSPS